MQFGSATCSRMNEHASLKRRRAQPSVRRGRVRSQVRSLAIMRALALVPGLLAVQTVLLTRSHAAQTDPDRLRRAVYVSAVVPVLGDAPGLRCLRASPPMPCVEF